MQDTRDTIIAPAAWACALFAGLLLLVSMPAPAGAASDRERSAQVGCSEQRVWPPSGLTRQRLRFDGQRREYLLYRPTGHVPQRPAPLVVDLHASTITPEIQLRITRMDAAAARAGAVLALPLGVLPAARGGTTWNEPPAVDGPDDAGFVQAVIADVATRVCVDAGRIYLTGYSGGARLASRVACELPGHVAGLGAVGGLRSPPPGCRRAVPVIAFHSLDDPVNPYHADPARSRAYWAYGVDEAAAGWAQNNRCTRRPNADALLGSVERLAWRGCTGAAGVMLYRSRGDGHTWPGSAFPYPDYVGGVNRGLDATGEIFRFFGLHPQGG